MALRLLDVGVDPSFAYEKEVGGENYVYFNNQYVYKFCPAVIRNIPAPPVELFKEKKESGTYRIFIIGESTSRGFPYSKLEAFPGQLLQFLNNTTGQKKFEVINMSMAATNAHIGVDVVNQVVRYQPDLAVFYYGHNEFIGFGGSAENRGFLYSLKHSLFHFRIYQGIKILLLKAAGEDAVSLLEERSGTQRVPFNSQVFNATLKNFSECYEQMIRKLKEKGIAVVTCGVAKNLRDFPPVNSLEPSSREREQLITVAERSTCSENYCR